MTGHRNRTVKLAAGAVVLFVAAALAAESASTYEELLGQADRMYRYGKQVEGVRLYGRIWTMRPNDLDSIIIWAERSADVGNYRWSRNFYRQAEARCGGDPTYLYRIYKGYARTYRKFGYSNYAQQYEEKAENLRASGRVADAPPQTGTSSGYYVEYEEERPQSRAEIEVEPPRPAPTPRAVGPVPPPRPAIPTPMAQPPAKAAEPLATMAEPPGPPAHYLKKRIAVAPVDVTILDSNAADFGTQLQAMMITELRKTDRFIVLEREALDDILKEQDLAASGRVAEGSGPQTGQLMGAQLLIKAQLTDFEDQSQQSRSVGVGPVDVGRDRATIRMAMDMRIFNAETGVIVAAENVAAEKVASGQDLDVAIPVFRWNDSKSQNSTLGFVTRELVRQALERIIAASEKVPWRATVMKEDEGKVYLNAGTDAGVRKGDRFVVFSTGDSLRDPDTGEVLGVEKEKVGEIEIVTVQEKYSIGYVTALPGGIKRGDTVVEMGPPGAAP